MERVGRLEKAVRGGASRRRSGWPALLLAGVLALAGCAGPVARQAGPAPGNARAPASGPAGGVPPTGGGSGGRSPAAPAARSFADAQALRAAWNGALDPFEADAALPPFQLDGDGRFLVFAGVHRLLAGQIQGSGYALDVLLDHPEQDGAAARQAILPLARILMRTVQPGLNAAEQARLLGALGLTGTPPAIPDRFVYGARTARSGEVTYVLSYAGGLIFSAERGSTTPARDSRLETEIKQGEALAAATPAVPLQTGQVEAAVAAAGAPEPLTPALLGDPARLGAALQQAARLVARLLPAPLGGAPPPPGAALLVPDAGMTAIRHLLERTFSAGLAGDLVTGEAWAHMAPGTVQGGSLRIRQPIFYGQGRLFILAEPPFAEGERYWAQVPLWADGTTYQLGFFRRLGGDAGETSVVRTEVQRASDGSATVTLEALLPPPEGSPATARQDARFTFHLVPAGDGTLRIDDVQTP
ncbi:MAG: hypothetical protein K6U79_10535, partial [Firmicutes bacterium]|nr:hypothetical protein [Bacillota bacterium]